MNTDLQKEIEQENNKWAEAVNSGRPEGLAELVTEDFIYMEPGSGPVAGPKGLVGEGRKWVENGATNETLKVVRCQGEGDLVYQWASFSVDFPGPESGALTTEKGMFIDIFRRQVDGRLKRTLQMLSY